MDYSNQFGRRNLSTYDRTRLAFKLEDLIKTKAKENQLSSLKKGSSSVLELVPKREEKIHTDEELAKLAGVSPKTIQYARKVEKEATPEQKERLSKGETKIKTVYKEISKKEDRSVQKTPNKQTTDWNKIEKDPVTGFPKVTPLYPLQESMASFSRVTTLVGNFDTEINNLTCAGELLARLESSELSEIYEQLCSVEKNVSNLKKIILKISEEEINEKSIIGN
jgi:DNA-binding XRE family transcriptional regulator